MYVYTMREITGDNNHTREPRSPFNTTVFKLRY